MGKIPSVAELERNLQYRKQRATRLEARQKTPPKVGSGAAVPRDTYKYQSIYGDNFCINTTRNGVAFFGATALGLVAPDDSPGEPRGFKPAQMHATLAKTSPTPKTAISGRKYLKYSVDPGSKEDRKQASYRAAISDNTASGLKTKIRNILRDKKDDVGEYGRIEFEPERPIFRASGTAGTAAPAPAP